MSVRVLHGDCREVLRTLDQASVHAVVTDPPYHLTSIVKRFGGANAAPAKFGKDGAYARASRGFMGKVWDGGDIAQDPELWAEVLRVMKPGAHLAAFGGTRTFHRMACAIEDAGFEIRDCLSWNYASGFPKSHNVSAAIDRCHCRISTPYMRNEVSREEGTIGAQGADPNDVRGMRHGEIQAKGLGQKDSEELLQLFVPQQDVRRSPPVNSASRTFGGDSSIQGCIGSQDDGTAQPRVEGRRDIPAPARKLRAGPLCSLPEEPPEYGPEGRLCDGASSRDGDVDRASANPSRVRPPHRSRSAEQRTRELGTLALQPQPQDGGAWPVCGECGKPRIPDGLGTALKPAWEPIILARKPICGTVVANVQAHGCGAINVDACRVAAQGRPLREKKIGQPDVDGKSVFGAGLSPGSRAIGDTDLGRWPANVLHDGSPEVEAAFAAFGERPGAASNGRKGVSGIFDDGIGAAPQSPSFGDSGSASRFFFCGKATAEDRAGSKHPTVKPLALMDWLVKLITPPGGTVLDPFAGSGTTLLAADRLGFDAIGIEQDAEYVADIHRRMQGDCPLFAEVSA